MKLGSCDDMLNLLRRVMLAVFASLFPRLDYGIHTILHLLVGIGP